MAGKLIITRGLPASGKSTWASAYAEEAAQRDEAVRIVTMDDIRTAIGAIFAAGDEPIVHSIRDYAIRRYLERGYTVISADTNLHPKTFKHVEGLAHNLFPNGETVSAEVEVQDFTDVPLDLCLFRNGIRWTHGDKKVPDEAIVSMHEKYIKEKT